MGSDRLLGGGRCLRSIERVDGSSWAWTYISIDRCDALRPCFPTRRCALLCASLARPTSTVIGYAWATRSMHAHIHTSTPLTPCATPRTGSNRRNEQTSKTMAEVPGMPYEQQQEPRTPTAQELVAGQQLDQMWKGVDDSNDRIKALKKQTVRACVTAWLRERRGAGRRLTHAPPVCFDRRPSACGRTRQTRR